MGFPLFIRVLFHHDASGAAPYDLRVVRFAPEICGLVMLLGGCSGGVSVIGTMEYPATVPLRTFPHVLVTSGHQQNEQALAEFLADHLAARGEVDARFVDLDTIRVMRERGETPRASVVVSLELDMEEDFDSRMTTRPETVCGPGGCYTRNRNTTVDIPQLRLRVGLIISAGPSAEVLQRLSFQILEEGRDWRPMLTRALAQARLRLQRLVDPRVQQVRVELLSVDVAEVQAALVDLRARRWRQGRIRLEQAARGDSVRVLPPAERARVYYNLHIARRFDPVSLAENEERHFRAAESPLRRALRLDPSSRYDLALRELEAHRAQVDMVRQQRAAAEHNFQLRGRRSGSMNIPDPPQAYRDAEPSDAPQ